MLLRFLRVVPGIAWATISAPWRDEGLRAIVILLAVLLFVLWAALDFLPLAR